MAPLSVSVDPPAVVTNGNDTNGATTPSTTAARPESVSPAESASSHLRPLPLSGETEPATDGDQEEPVIATVNGTQGDKDDKDEGRLCVFINNYPPVALCDVFDIW